MDPSSLDKLLGHSVGRLSGNPQDLHTEDPHGHLVHAAFTDEQTAQTDEAAMSQLLLSAHPHGAWPQPQTQHGRELWALVLSCVGSYAQPSLSQGSARADSLQQKRSLALQNCRAGPGGPPALGLHPVFQFLVTTRPAFFCDISVMQLKQFLTAALLVFTTHRFIFVNLFNTGSSLPASLCPFT